MKSFFIDEPYFDENNRKILNANPLPEKYCTFDCVFCPLGKTVIQSQEQVQVDGTHEFIANLSKTIDEYTPDIVYFNLSGDPSLNSKFSEMIDLAHSKNAKVKLLTNGYLCNKEPFKTLMNSCEYVVGELALTCEKDFQKLQRPILGFTLNNYVNNMSEFKKQYNGEFTLSITILKNYSDSYEDALRFKSMVKKIDPDFVTLETPSRPKFKSSLGADMEAVNNIASTIKSVCKNVRIVEELD